MTSSSSFFEAASAASGYHDDDGESYHGIGYDDCESRPGTGGRLSTVDDDVLSCSFELDTIPIRQSDKVKKGSCFYFSHRHSLLSALSLYLLIWYVVFVNLFYGSQ
jgi:hypothetical protein